MRTLRIEHPVGSFEARKRALDNDPIGRQRMGVRRDRILRPADDPHFVAVDLESGGPDGAAALRAALDELWRPVEGARMRSRRARILETVESREY